MKLLTACLLQVLLMTACHMGASDPPRLKPLPLDAAVLAFGDSITFGTGAAPGQDYPAVLQRLISRSVLNAGIPGEVTAEGLARLPELLDRYHPALLLLCLGANDMLRGLDEGAAAENLRKMVKSARKRGIHVVLIGYPRPPLLSVPPEFYDRISREYSLPYLKDSLGEILQNPSLRADSIHPNALGYRKLAEDISRLLRKDGFL